jgi:hypothetical protein
MNMHQLSSSPVLDSTNHNLKPGYMLFLQQPAVAPAQVANTNPEETRLIPEDELHAILWDNVYSGQ